MPAELDLVVSTDHVVGFETEEAERIRAGLGKHLSVGEPSFYLRLSADEMAVIIRILGEAAAWVPLLTAATAFLARLAKHAAEATWRGVGNLFAGREADPLIEVVKTLEKEANREDGRQTMIVLGLNSPDNYWGTVMSFQSGDSEEDIAMRVANFCVLSERIEIALRSAIKTGNYPEGSVFLEPQDDGSMLASWHSREGNKTNHHKLRIS